MLNLALLACQAFLKGLDDAILCKGDFLQCSLELGLGLSPVNLHLFQISLQLSVLPRPVASLRSLPIFECMINLLFRRLCVLASCSNSNASSSSFV